MIINLQKFASDYFSQFCDLVHGNYSAKYFPNKYRWCFTLLFLKNTNHYLFLKFLFQINILGSPKKLETFIYYSLQHYY